MPRPLVGTPVVDKKHVHDLILWEIEKRYTRTSVKVTTGTYEIGQRIANPTLADESVPVGGQPSFSDVLCLENITVVADDGAVAIPVLARGPALVSLDQVVKVSEDETDAEVITRMADLIAQGVRFVKEPVVQTSSGRDS